MSVERGVDGPHDARFNSGRAIQCVMTHLSVRGKILRSVSRSMMGWCSGLESIDRIASHALTWGSASSKRSKKVQRLLTIDRRPVGFFELRTAAAASISNK